MKKLFLIFAVICLVSVYAATSLAAEVAAAEDAAKGPSVTTKGLNLDLSGYVQTSYTVFDDDAGEDDTFKIKRARLKVAAEFFPMWHTLIQYDFASSALKDAYVTYEPRPEFKLKAGQYKIPYALEERTSSSKIATIDRSEVLGEIATSRDIGLMAEGELMEGLVEYGIGVFNGNETGGTDDNDKKDVVGRVAVCPARGSEGPLAGLMVAGAFQIGEQPMMGVDALGAEIVLGDEQRTRYIGTASWTYNNFTAQGEYAFQDLEDTGVESDGYYVLAVYDFETNGIIVSPVVKYETFDPDDSVGDDETNVTTLGVTLHFNGKKDYTKLLINYRIIDEEPVDMDNNEIIVQWQGKF